MLISGDEYDSLPKQIIEEYNLSRDTDDTSNICHAPFKVMFLRIDGKVITCCGNIEYILGDIKQNTLEEIWMGEKAKRLRNIFSNNRFQAGCSRCVDDLYMKSFSSVIARSYDNLPKAEKYPLRIDFNLSNVCNLACETCNTWSSSYIREKNYDLFPLSNKYNNSEFYEQLKPFLINLKESFFIGGEPFLIKEFFTIWSMMKEINPNINIIVNTNGTILNDKVKNVLESLPFNLNISIDSLNKENFETIRRNASFEKTMENLTYFIEYSKRKNTFLNLTVCPLVKNWEEIPELVKFSVTNDIALYFNTVRFPIEHSLFSFSKEKLNVVRKHLLSIKIDANNINAEITKKQIEMLIHQISHFYKDAKMKALAKADEKDQNNCIIAEIKEKKFITTQKLIIAKQQQLINNIKGKITENTIDINNDYVLFMLKEINKYVDKNRKYPLEIKENVKENCKAKLKMFFLNYKDELWINDVIPRIYKNIPIYDIIKSLLSDSEESLKQGFDKLKS